MYQTYIYTYTYRNVILIEFTKYNMFLILPIAIMEYSLYWNCNCLMHCVTGSLLYYVLQLKYKLIHNNYKQHKHCVISIHFSIIYFTQLH